MIVFSVTISTAFIAAFGVLVSPRQYRAKTWFAALLVVLAFEMLMGAFGERNGSLPFWLAQLSQGFELLYGPLFYTYVCFLLDPSRSFTKSDALQFAPALVGALIPGQHEIMVPLTFAHIFVYTVIGVYLMWTADRRVDSKVRKALPRIQVWMSLMVFTLFATFALSVIQYVFPAVPKIVTYLSVVCFFVVFFVFHFRFPEVFYNGSRSRAGQAIKQSQQKLGLEPEASPKLWQSSVEYIEREKPFTNPDLDLRMLAEQLGLTAGQLSHLVNSEEEESFYEFINRLRVRHAQHLLRGDERAGITDIMVASGFKSKSTFYKAFRAATGMTPSEFRASAFTQ